MSSLSYDEIFSRLYSIVRAYDFLDLSELQINEFLCNWLHASVAPTRVRRLFSSIKLDDEIRMITFEIKHPIDINDDYSDKEFVIQILAKGLAINWLEPKVMSMETVSQTYGTSELKFYSESSHMKEIKDLMRYMMSSQKQEIADYTATWNAYLSGVS